MVKLDGRRCVVVGAGRVAATKIRGLLACGARVTVVSPEAGSLVRTQASKGTLVWRRKSFSPGDLKGALLAIAATDSSAVNAAVFRSCQTRKLLCNSVDDPAHCDFFYPAVVRRGPLQIAVSTSGRSPGLAARLRRHLAHQFGPEWSDFVESLGRQREEILKTASDLQKRILLRRIALSASKKTRTLKTARSLPAGRK